MRPPNPRRIRNVIYAFGIYAETKEIERMASMSGASAMASAGG